MYFACTSKAHIHLHISFGAVACEIRLLLCFVNIVGNHRKPGFHNAPFSAMLFKEIAALCIYFASMALKCEFCLA